MAALMQGLSKELNARQDAIVNERVSLSDSYDNMQYV